MQVESSNPLLATKLFIPPAHTRRVPRSRLVERMKATARYPLMLVCAPAGYGKTSLLSEWIPQNEHCVTWFSIDEGDNDPVRYWRHFLAALQTLKPDLCQNARQLLESVQNPQIEPMLTLVINDLAALDFHFVHVCDDYHLIENAAIHKHMVFLVEHLPPNVHLVLTSRRDPALPLARWRARRQLVEIRSNDLRFTPEESTDFFNRLMQLDLSTGEIEALANRTEGWIAGMQLAALSIKDASDRAGFITAFTGSHRYIIDYLAEEVLNQQTEPVREFLLSTSLLDRMCGALCDALTGHDDGQEMLERLEQANLFIVPLDENRHWYRFHQLFANVLQAHLKLTHPDRVNEYHRRAAGWFASRGIYPEAVRHALLGEHYELAAQLIEAVAGVLLRQGASVSLILWLDAMPDDLIRSRPVLCLARAWTFHWGPVLDVESADEWAELALLAASRDGVPGSEIQGEALAVKTLTTATRSEAARTMDLARAALDNLPLDSPWRGLMALCLGTSAFDSGDMASAREGLSEALQLSLANGSFYVQLVAASFLADIHVFQGQLTRADEMYRQVLSWANPDLPQKGDVMAHGGLAAIYYERNQIADALAHVQLGLAQIERVGGAWPAHALFRVLARIQLAQGDWESALATLERSNKQGVMARVSLVVSQSAALRASVLLSQGDLPSARAWAANSGLTADDPEASHPGWREIEYLTLARLLAAEGQPQQAFTLTDRLLDSARSEARLGSVITILVVQCLLAQLLGSTLQALQLLENALELAEPEGYLRVFIDEGVAMHSLILELRSILANRQRTHGNHNSQTLLLYVLRLLAGFSSKDAPPAPGGERLAEPLSDRELEVLRLIGVGLSNQEIAGEMVVALSTVKSHINHLYGKLGAHNRVQAVAIARSLGLLSD